MRIILLQLKDMLIPGLIFVFMVSVIVVPNLPAVGSSLADADQTTDYTAYLDSSAYRTVSERAAPVISCDTDQIWKTENPVIVGQAFTALDAVGNLVSLQVLKIEDAAENDLTESYEKDTDSVTFSDAGVYYFTLRAIDTEQKETELVIPLVIDKEGI